MMKIWKYYLRILFVVLFVSVGFLLIWCWDSWDKNATSSINVGWFELHYNGGIKFEKVRLKADDLDEIDDLFQEVWSDSSDFKDSLLIARKYNQWMWVNAFAQDNLDTLKDRGLTLSKIEKTQIWIEKHWEKINAVLVEYEITQWLVDEIPLLYVSQLFIPQNKDMILMSFITENHSSQSSASSMFKNVK